MNTITKYLTQTIVYWGNPVLVGGGVYTYDTPVEILGRWEDKQQVFFDKHGRELKSSSIIFLKQDVDDGGFLYLGTLASIASAIDESHPKNVNSAEEIRGFRKIPNMRVTDFERVAFISKMTGAR